MKNTHNLLHTFSVDIVSKVDGQRYEGTFVTKKLSVMGMAELRVRTLQLCKGLRYDPENPDVGVDRDTYNLNSMLAHLEIAVVEHPDWWNLDQITDLELMSEVHKEVVDFENNFPGLGSGKASKAGSPKEASKTDSGGVSEPVVVGEVQASLEP